MFFWPSCIRSFLALSRDTSTLQKNVSGSDVRRSSTAGLVEKMPKNDGASSSITKQGEPDERASAEAPASEAECQPL